MLNEKNKIQGLGKAQKLVVSALAKNGARTSNALAAELAKNPANTHRLFKKLEGEFIKRVSEKEYRGRFFNEYWLTLEGAKQAMMQGVDVEIMIEHAKSIYENKELREFLAVADMSMFSPEVLKAEIAFRAGDLSTSKELIDATGDFIKIFPEYLAKHPEVAAELEQHPIMGKMIDFILELGKKEKN